MQDQLKPNKLVSSLVILTATMLISAAPAAMSADAHPDFSGVWRANAVAGANAFAVGNKLPPFTPEAKAKVDEYRALVAENADNPSAFCLGTGMPGGMLGSGVYPMEWIQRPEQITIIYEAHTELRRVYMTLSLDKLDPNDIIPSRDGFSTGHWEGNTLVVETAYLKEAIDQSTPHSDQAKIIERYSMSKDDKGNKILTAEMVMTDPVFFKEPVKLTKTWKHDANTRMMYYECTETNWEDHVEALREAAKQKASAKASADSKK
jgi:hypothetical protein